MTGGLAVDIDWPYTELDLKEILDSGEFAEFLPVDIEYYEDDWEYEEIKDEEDQDN